MIGAALVAATLHDLFTTAIAVGRGAGPISGRLARWSWRGLLRIHRRRGAPAMLRAGGPMILIMIIVTWIMSLIVGWSLVFGQRETLVSINEGTPVPVLGRLYYAAATIIGRGSAAARPAGDLWQGLEVVAALTGFAVLSLSIAYVIPVVQGVVAKREVALSISALGTTAEQILGRAWNGHDLGDLHLHIVALVPRIAGIAQRHLAYPIIHYFHSHERVTAIGPSIVALDEAMTLNGAIHPDARLPTTASEPLRQATTVFLQTLQWAFVPPTDADIAEPSVEPLRRRGIPLSDDTQGPLSGVRERRRLLRGYLEQDGWGEGDLLPLVDAG